MVETLQVQQRGTMTLPAIVREQYGIKPSDTFSLVDLDGMFVLTPVVPMVPELAREIERLRQASGLTVAALLAGLREQREQYYQEYYGRDVVNGWCARATGARGRRHPDRRGLGRR